MRNNKYQSKQGAKNYPRKEKVQSVQTDTRQVTGIRKKSADYYKNVQMWFIFVFAILLYSNTLFFDYTLDDQLMIYNNKFTTMGVAGFKKILSTDSFTGFFGESKQLVAGGRYRPLSHLMFAVEWQIFGKSPFEGHLFNVLLYGLACMLLFKVLTMLFNNNVKSGWYISLPFVIAALFTAHPLHTEVVANIKGRDEILSLLGSIGTMYFVLRYYETRKNTLLLYAGIVYFLGLMAKENAITYLAVIPLAVYFLKDKSLKESMICLIPMLVGAVLFIGLRTNAIGMDLNGKPVTELLNNPFIDWKAGHEYPAAMKYATIMYTLALYIKLMILPHPLTHDYYPFQIPIIGFSDYRAIISVLIYIVLIVIAVRGFLRKSIVSYGIIIFIATLSIASNLVFPIGTFMNERFLFSSVLGFIMILAFMIDKYLIKQEGKKYIGIALLGIIICLYSVKTYSRNFTWKDDYTLFTTDVKTSTNSAKCNVSAGGLSIEEAKKQKTKEEKMKYIDQALTYLHKAANLYPKNDVVWLLLGNAHLETEKYNLSVEYYDQSLRLSPGYKDALNNLLYVAQVTHRNKQYPWSILAYKTLVRHQPNNTEHLIELSNLYDETNRIDTALVILNSIVEKKPDYYQAYSKIGEIYGKRLNQIDMAISYLKKAYAINPNDGSVNENLGVAYGIKGDFKESIKYMLNSIKLDPNNPQTYFNLSASYNRIGEKKLAAEYMNKAIAVQKSQQQKAKN